MTVTRPEDINERFARGFNERGAIRDEDDEVLAAATSAEVLTRRPDGSWVYLVDRPFAAGPDHVA